MAALDAPRGVYNVVDDRPLPRGEYVDALADALGVPSPTERSVTLELPAPFSAMLRSLRVSNQRLKETTGWQPRFPSAWEGWAAVIADWRTHAPGPVWRDDLPVSARRRSRSPHLSRFVALSRQHHDTDSSLRRGEPAWPSATPTLTPSGQPSGLEPWLRRRVARRRGPDRDDQLDQMNPDTLARDFNEYRPRLLGIAYRMLGSAWDAEDVVAEAMVRWMGVDREQVREPLAFLTTVVTRLAIDQLRSARATRETYVGEWLPEPVLTDPSRLGPLDTVERRDTVSLATLRMMEALTPPERAVLVLHEAFDMSHAEVADILGISEAGARQHLRRARSHLDRDVGRSGRAVHDETLARFLTALENGDLAQVQDLLATDVASYSDGGGRAHAARRRILGAEHIVQYVGTLRRHLPVRDVRRSGRERTACGHPLVRPPVHTARPRRSRRKDPRDPLDHEPGQAPIFAPTTRRRERSTAEDAVVTASVVDRNAAPSPWPTTRRVACRGAAGPAGSRCTTSCTVRTAGRRNRPTWPRCVRHVTVSTTWVVSASSVTPMWRAACRSSTPGVV